MKPIRFDMALAAAILTAAILSPAANAQTKIEVPWMELAQALDGHVVSTALVDGTVLRGRVLRVSDSELRFQVKSTSRPVFYPKGEVSVARDQVKVFSYTFKSGSRGRKIGAAVGGAAGLIPTLLVASVVNGEGGDWTNVELGVVGVLAGIVGAGLGIGYGIGNAADTKTMTVFVAQSPESPANGNAADAAIEPTAER